MKFIEILQEIPSLSEHKLTLLREVISIVLREKGTVYVNEQLEKNKNQ